MATRVAMTSTGSPTKRTVPSFAVFDENFGNQVRASERATRTEPLPLTTSKFANQQIRSSVMSQGHAQISAKEVIHDLVTKHHQQLWPRSYYDAAENHENKSITFSDIDRDVRTPAADSVISDYHADDNEVERLKRELELAKERMAQMDLQLTQSRLAQHTMEEAIGSPFPAAQHLAANILTHNMIPDSSVGSLTRAATPYERTQFNEFPCLQSESLQSLGASSSAFGNRSGVSTPPTSRSTFSPAYMMPKSMSPALQPPVGTRLSATAAEFGGGRGSWSGHQSPTTYVSTTEPLNYRRLLDRNASCDWKYIVDKIVCNNDQQASIFLQQKLKVGTIDQKYEIVQAILEQAYPLMVNRFGNFLVQRCFEHGTPEQVVCIAQAIRGNTLALSMDAFGCHVVQKAFDCVPEEYKAIMVHELLRRIPETVIHRYACHVWQKLFELRWSDSPPQIMKYVNEALRGMWHEVALGETGSLVVQNIFENCLEEDKRPCIDEVLSNIDIVAHGQFGNWCIQHICEHGSIPDRTRATEHVLRFAGEYSTDQFASKVVEKCLKIGGTEFLDRYLNRLCEAHPDRPRMPLIDIAGDQFGNYLVQYILSNGEAQRRDIVATHIRKHMVSLRGSKYGSRVAMLCCNPAIATRPGPPSNFSQVSRNGNGPGDHRYGSTDLRPCSQNRVLVSRGGFNGAYR